MDWSDIWQAAVDNGFVSATALAALVAILQLVMP